MKPLTTKPRGYVNAIDTYYSNETSNQDRLKAQDFIRNHEGSFYPFYRRMVLAREKSPMPIVNTLIIGDSHSVIFIDDTTAYRPKFGKTLFGTLKPYRKNSDVSKLRRYADVEIPKTSAKDVIFYFGQFDSQIYWHKRSLEDVVTLAKRYIEVINQIQIDYPSVACKVMALHGALPTGVIGSAEHAAIGGELPLESFSSAQQKINLFNFTLLTTVDNGVAILYRPLICGNKVSFSSDMFEYLPRSKRIGIHLHTGFFNTPIKDYE